MINSKVKLKPNQNKKAKIKPRKYMKFHSKDPSRTDIKKLEHRSNLQMQ